MYTDLRISHLLLSNSGVLKNNTFNNRGIYSGYFLFKLRNREEIIGELPQKRKGKKLKRKKR